MLLSNFAGKIIFCPSTLLQGDRSAGLQRGEQPRAVPAGGQGGARQHHLPTLQQVSTVSTTAAAYPVFFLTHS